MLVIVFVRIAYEARVGAMQQFWCEIRIILHHEHRQIGVGSIQSWVGLHNGNAAHEEGFPEPVGVEAQAGGTEHEASLRRGEVMIHQRTCFTRGVGVLDGVVEGPAN